MILPPPLNIGIYRNLSNKFFISFKSTKIDFVVLMNILYYPMVKASILFSVIKLLISNNLQT